MSDSAVVCLYGRRIGTLELVDEDLQEYEFHYDQSYLHDPHSPVLGQLFIDRWPGPIRTSGFPLWFAHLLPGGPWRRHLERWAKLEERDDDFALLVAIGHDLPGAVTLTEGSLTATGRTEFAVVTPPPPDAVRFSLAGAQWKLSVKRDERGVTVPVRGQHGEFIAKFEDPAFPDLPAVETCTTHWAERAGISAHTVRLEPIGRFVELPDGMPPQREFLLAERFDRNGDQKVHMEDFAQVIDRPRSQIYRGAYEDIAALVQALCPEDFEEFVRRVVFMVCSGNGDAHLKNWSIIYPDWYAARLTPAYDLVSTVAYPAIDRQLALTLGGSHTWDAMQPSRFHALARLGAWTDAKTNAFVAETATRIRDCWSDIRDDAPERMRAPVDEHLAQLGF